MLLSIAAIFALSTSAQADAKRITALGSGTESCGAWIADRKEPGAGAAIDLEWVLGFLTGFNQFGQFTGDVTKGIDKDGIAAWVDNFCSQNPLLTVEDASSALVLALLAKNGAKIGSP
jgi:hypothetical protein